MPSDVPPLATVGRGIRLCSLLSVFYIRHKSGPIPRRIRIESFGAGDAHFASRCATVAPQGEIQTLGEHGLLCRRFGRHARHGAPFYVFGAVLKLGASARIWRCSCARCLWLNGTLPASLCLRPDHHG